MLAVLLFFLSPRLSGEATGIKFFRNYSFKDYNHQPQNWGMVQMDSGLIYVANNGGVLEYDGVTWRVIRAPGYNPVRSLAVTPHEIIYIGGQNDLGYLKPDEKGSLQFHSLRNFLPEKQKDFSAVWGTYVVGDHFKIPLS